MKKILFLNLFLIFISCNNTDETDINIDTPDTVTLTPINLKTNGLELNWTVSNEIKFYKYKISRSEYPNGPFEEINSISEANTTTYLDSDVSFGVYYHYQVSVVLLNGNQSKSNIEFKLFENESIYLGPNIVRIKNDKVRPYIYALSKTYNSLLFINKESKVVEKTIPVGPSPSDLDINLDNSKMYIANYGSSKIAVIDLDTQEKIYDLSLDTQSGLWDGNPYRLVCIGSDKLVYTSEDQWNYIKLLNASDGSLISWNSSVYYPGLITNPDKTSLFVTESNSTGVNTYRYNLENDQLSFVERSEKFYYYNGFGTRDACISQDGKYLFYIGSKLMLNDLQTNLGSFSDTIYACNYDGSIAIGSEYIWDANNFSIIRKLPFKISGIMVLDTDDKTLYIYNKNNLYILTIK